MAINRVVAEERVDTKIIAVSGWLAHFVHNLTVNITLSSHFEPRFPKSKMSERYIRSDSGKPYKISTLVLYLEIHFLYPYARGFIQKACLDLLYL